MRYLSLALLFGATLPAQNLAEPFLSPNRAEVFFTSGGDIWRASDKGGEASLVVSHSADESRPMPSPDGKLLAFQSNRSGNGDIYILALDTGEVRRLTYDSSPDVLNNWSRDGKWIYFHSSSHDISAMNDLYRIPASGGTPERLMADAYTNEFFGAPSPDGQALVFCARGTADRQWWRHGHSHLDESELWIKKGTEEPAQITPRGSKHLWPMWSADGKRIFYMSDEDGNENLYSLEPGQKAKQLTTYRDGRLLWPSISYSGKTIVFERNFKLYRLETETNKITELPITLHSAPASLAPERRQLTTGFSELAVAPDGKKVAFIARGEVFAAGTRDAGDATRVTSTAGVEANLDWNSDSKILVYTSDRDGAMNIYAYDFVTKTESALTVGRATNSLPRWSPDGKQIAYVREGKEIRVIDFASRQDVKVADGRFTLPPLDGGYLPSWSPDSKWIAYINRGEKNFRNVFVVKATGGVPQQVSFLPNTNSGSAEWAPDGEAIYFRTGQRTETSYIVRIELRIKSKPLREDKFDELFTAAVAAQKDDTKEEKKPLTIDADGIKRRASLLPLDLDVGQFAISSDGKMLVFSAQSGKQTQFYTVSLDPLQTGPMIPRQLTSTPGAKNSPQFSADSKDIYFLDQGKVAAIAVESRVARPFAITAELTADFNDDKRQLYSQAWGNLNTHFYDPKFHGTDWAAARERFERPAMASKTPEEFRRVVNLMIGELNASHLGFNLPATPSNTGGRLGVDFSDATTFTVASILPLGPVALVGGIQAGMRLTAINGETLTPATNIDRILEFTSGKKTLLTFAERSITIQPITGAAEKQLRYKSWVDANRTLVDKLSGGKLSYAHIPDMSEDSLNQFYLDLDEDAHKRKGVVIDVRNNNGGFVNVYAIDVLARKSYFSMKERGDETAIPSRTALGQRALDLPTILLTNQHSLSDAEDFTEGYRYLKLGKTVGEPTAGWIIFTWNLGLYDGSTLRLPRQAITDTRGQIMERNPRPVDIAVERPIGEASREGTDSQLSRAVTELLSQVR